MLRRRHAPAGRTNAKPIAALIALVLIFGAVVIAFGRQSFLASGHEVKAVFSTASNLRNGNPVRIGGLDIGRVVSIESGTDRSALVTMRIKPDAPALRVDTRMAIKPRLAFEGNFYIDVDAGTPGSAKLEGGDTVPLSHTSTPVQLDQLLTTLDADTRGSMVEVVGTLADGLGADDGSTATGADGLRRASRALRRSLGSTGRVAAAMRGQRAGDLGRGIRSTANLTTTLARDPQALAEIIDEYDRVIGAFSDERDGLRVSLRHLSSLMRNAPDALTRIDRALPDVRRLSTALLPVLRELPPTLKPANAAFAQLATMTLPAELPRLVRLLEDPVRNLPALMDQLDFALPMLSPLGQCLEKKIWPTLNSAVPDGELSTGQPAWLEILHAASNLTGGSAAFDANGVTFRAGLAQGTNTIRGLLPGLGEMVTALDSTLDGVRPIWLGPNVRPPKRPDANCLDQAPVSLHSESGTPFAGFKPAGYDAKAVKSNADQTKDAVKTLERALGSAGEESR
ncbi:MAG: MlaD family protein [Solirubrobacteraceae bacterium]|nr:MlaD family protein [Solirubrobacteraceae bacterium]